jgi:hypothetical protein
MDQTPKSREEIDAAMGVEPRVPPFIQIVTAVSASCGRTPEDSILSEMLYGLDAKGRVWEWNRADPDRKGALDGWKLIPNTLYNDGEEPAVKRATR